LLQFLPDDVSGAVSFRVTQNTITSQVAGMVINGMFNTQDDIELLVEVCGNQSAYNKSLSISNHAFSQAATIH
jgi:acid phosphatase